MDRLWIVAALVAVLVVGFVSIIRVSSSISQRAILAREFLERLKAYWGSGGRDYEAYGWMTHRSGKLQNELGALGIFASYKPPYANYIQHNVPAVFTMLPELRKCLEDDYLRDKSLTSDYFNSLQEILIRHVGSLSDQMDTVDKALRNPIAWLREGVREIVALPVSLLGWLGLLSTAAVDRIVGAAPFRFIAGLFALVGAISAIVGLVTGWGPFVAIVSTWVRDL